MRRRREGARKDELDGVAREPPGGRDAAARAWRQGRWRRRTDIVRARMRLTLTRPDDWHLHLRDGEPMRAVLSDSARRFGRAIVMPNLKPPVTTVAAARDYRQRILAALPAGAS